MAPKTAEPAVMGADNFCSAPGNLHDHHCASHIGPNWSSGLPGNLPTTIGVAIYHSFLALVQRDHTTGYQALAEHSSGLFPACFRAAVRGRLVGWKSPIAALEPTAFWRRSGPAVPSFFLSPTLFAGEMKF